MFPFFIFSFIHALFYNHCFSPLSLAGAHWWLFLWSGHQPASRRFSAGDWSHALHRDPGPHDFGHLLCLQWLLCSLCGHQKWTAKEGAYQLIFSFHNLKATCLRFLLRSSLWYIRTQAVQWSSGYGRCEVVLFPCRWIIVTRKRISLIFKACCQMTGEG